jgi:hypothetical protein
VQRYCFFPKPPNISKQKFQKIFSGCDNGSPNTFIAKSLDIENIRCTFVSVSVTLSIMGKVTLNIDVPSGINIDIDSLKALATKYIQQHIYMVQGVHRDKNEGSKSTASFLKLRGILSSTLSYDEMKEAALTEMRGATT